MRRGGARKSRGSNTTSVVPSRRGSLSRYTTCPRSSDRTCSTRWAAVSAMRRPPQLGQKPRRLQLNAASFSYRKASHVTRRNPYSRRPHFRYAANSSTTKWGSETPSASRRSRNRGKCSSTRAQSGVCRAGASTSRCASPPRLEQQEAHHRPRALNPRHPSTPCRWPRVDSPRASKEWTVPAGPERAARCATRGGSFGGYREERSARFPARRSPNPLALSDDPRTAAGRANWPQERPRTASTRNSAASGWAAIRPPLAFEHLERVLEVRLDFLPEDESPATSPSRTWSSTLARTRW